MNAGNRTKSEPVVVAGPSVVFVEKKSPPLRGALVVLLLTWILAPLFAWGGTEHPFNDYVREMREDSKVDTFWVRLCSDPAISLSRIATDSGIKEGDDFVKAFQDLYCFDRRSDELLLKRLEGVVYENDAGNMTRLKSMGQLRELFGEGLPVERPWSLWVHIKAGGEVVEVSVEREGGSDALSMHLVNGVWVFLRVRNGGGC